MAAENLSSDSPRATKSFKKVKRMDVRYINRNIHGILNSRGEICITLRLEDL
jgi:hypothetical protein